MTQPAVHHPIPMSGGGGGTQLGPNMMGKKKAFLRSKSERAHFWSPVVCNCLTARYLESPHVAWVALSLYLAFHGLGGVKHFHDVLES